MRLLRDDVLLSPLHGEPGCELFDERNGKSYKFGEVEHYLLEKFQKPYRIDDLVANCNEHFDQEFSEQDICEFFDLLAEWKLLRKDDKSQHSSKEQDVDVEEGDEEDNIDSESFEKQDLRMPNRWHLFNPQSLFDSLNRLLFPFRKLVWLTPFIFAFGLITAMSNLDAFLIGIAEAKSTFGIVGRLLIAAVTINLISQVSRGLVARYFHLSTPSLGIMLIFGVIPRFNVQTKIDRSLSRSARLWLAGISPIMSMLLFSFAVVLWAVIRPSGSSVAFIGSELVFVATISFVITALPFMPGNGMNLFSALLDIPNLQKRSQLAMASLFVSQPDVIKKHSKKHRMAFALFGLLSFAFILFVISFIGYIIFSSLELRFQGAGVSVFLLLVAYFIWNRRKQKKAREANKLLQKERHGHHMSQHEEFDSKSAYGLANGIKESSVDGGVWKKRFQWIFFLIVLIIVMMLPYRYETGGTAEVFPVAKASVSSETSGIIDQVFVRGGAWVEAGEKLARMSHYRQLKDVAVSEVLFRYSRGEFKRLAPLYKKGVITQEDYEKAKKDLEKLEYELKYYKEELHNTYLFSPIQGQIIGEDLEFKKYSYIGTGDVFIEIENTRTVSVRIEVPESDISDAKPGSKVQIKLWAYPDMIFSGKVDEIDPSTATEEAQYGRVVYVTSHIDNPEGLLISGLTGHAKITGEETIVIFAFSRAFVRFLRIEVWSWLP